MRVDWEERPEKTDSVVKWSSSDPDIVSVEDGVITRIKEGAATVTASLGDATASTSILDDDLSYFVIPGGVKTIKTEAFMDTASLQALDLSKTEGLVIEEGAFMNASKLVKVTLPKNFGLSEDWDCVLYCQDEETAERARQAGIPYVMYSTK